jgi:hypothetical protein
MGAARALLLGRVHGRVGLPNEILGATAARTGHRNTDAASHDRLLVIVHDDRFCHDLQEPSCDLHDRLAAWDLVAKYQELVAPVPPSDITSPDGACETIGDGRQYSVSYIVAQGVVEQFEVVEVDEHHRNEP